MIDKNKIPEYLHPILAEKLKGREDEINFPPPVFEAMEGVVVSYDADKEVLLTRHPCRDDIMRA